MARSNTWDGVERRSGGNVDRVEIAESRHVIFGSVAVVSIDVDTSCTPRTRVGGSTTSYWSGSD